MINNLYQGAWMTDIDDTLVLSGEMPDQSRLDAISKFTKVLKKHEILWIPMSGVAMVKLGPRILFRLPEDDFSHIYYYGGDGSLKYYFDEESKEWKEDNNFSRLFSDAQSLIVLGEMEFRESLVQLSSISGSDSSAIENQISSAKELLIKKGYDLSDCILDILKVKLDAAGIDPKLSETYFRGGSVSWMMLGDVSADPYHEESNLKLRFELIELSRKWLKDHNDLSDIGTAGISVPFPGARGIKFVLKGNDKERSARDLMRWTGLNSKELLYAGNELFDGGNDNMLRKIESVTLLSVGDKEDPGHSIVHGRIGKDGNNLEGVHANLYWMDWVAGKLEKGEMWVDILEEMRSVNG